MDYLFIKYRLLDFYKKSSKKYKVIYKKSTYNISKIDNEKNK